MSVNVLFSTIQKNDDGCLQHRRNMYNISDDSWFYFTFMMYEAYGLAVLKIGTRSPNDGNERNMVIFSYELNILN